jgi:SAM-dependent methyltransferase
MSKRNCRAKVEFVIWLVVLAGCAVPATAAQLGSREGKVWIETLERPERIAGLKVDEIIARLGLKPGIVVADIGAGSGVFSRPMAKAVAPGGRVLAVDIDQTLLDYMAQRAKQENLPNIQTVLGKFEDPNLPTKQVDLAFFHDVLHHIENRQAYLKNLAASMKPQGRIALVEMDEHDPKGPHHDTPAMLMSRKQVDVWMAEIGFHPVQDFDLFPGKKWFVIYQRQSTPPMSHEDMGHEM